MRCNNPIKPQMSIITNQSILPNDAGSVTDESGGGGGSNGYNSEYLRTPACANECPALSE